jgi:hypothetical protein
LSDANIKSILKDIETEEKMSDSLHWMKV